MPGTADVDPTRPIRPIDQPARLAALEAAVRARTDLVPEIGIVLGSGLGGLADELEDPVAIPFADLPGWPAATAPGLVIQPVLLFRRLGAHAVILTNAAGGLDPSFGPGTLMVISDHINLTG